MRGTGSSEFNSELIHAQLAPSIRLSVTLIHLLVATEDEMSRAFFTVVYASVLSSPSTSTYGSFF